MMRSESTNAFGHPRETNETFGAGAFIRFDPLSRYVIEHRGGAPRPLSREIMAERGRFPAPCPKAPVYKDDFRCDGALGSTL